VPSFHQAPNHVGAHPPQTNHSQLHFGAPLMKL
jgi:hypothetical protein